MANNIISDYENNNKITNFDESNIQEEVILQQLEKFNTENEQRILNEKKARRCNDVLSNMLIHQTNEMTIHESKQSSNFTVNLNDVHFNNKNVQVTNLSPNEDNISGREVELVNEVIKKVFNGSDELGGCSFGDINIEQSDQIHVGNVTYVNGPVHINYNVNKIEYTTDVKQEVYVSSPVDMVQTLPMVYRDMWLAQPPMEEIQRPDPAKLIIICHTATSSSTTQSGNVSAVRLMQTYHIESNGWSDIAYNFIIGCDGQVYEGRGWRNIGAHSKGYNAKSLGIAFIGTFLNTIPSQEALNVCQRLIESGVRGGMIDPNYKLIGHCQCRPFLSPGDALYRIIRTWPHWTDNRIDYAITQLNNNRR